MIESFLKLFSSRRSESNHSTVEQDAFLQLIDTRLSFGTDSFLQDIIFLVLCAPNPTSIIHRIMVKRLVQVKHPLPPPHEGMVAELIDTDRPDAEPLVIFLGRTASYNCPNPNYFSSHPDSNTVLESIVHTLTEMPSSILTTSGSNDSSSPLISLFDFKHTPSLLYHPIIDEPESDHEPKCNASTRLPWFDDVTLVGAKVLHASTPSTRTSYRAEDQFVGSQIIKAYVPSLENLRQIKLKPNSLSLFNLAVLADSVTMTHCILYWSITVTGLLKSSVLLLKRCILALQSIARNMHLFLRTQSAFLPMTLCQTWLAEWWGYRFAKLRRQSYQLWLPISRHTKKPSILRCISWLIVKDAH